MMDRSSASASLRRRPAVSPHAPDPEPIPGSVRVAVDVGRTEKKMEVNPLCAPPSQYNEKIFKMNQPFLKARSTPRTVENFLRKMDDSVVQYAIMNGFYDSMLQTDRIYRKGGSVSLEEMANRQVHLSLLDGFEVITRPRKQTFHDHTLELAAIGGVEVDYVSDEPTSCDEEEDFPNTSSNEDFLLRMGGDGDEALEESGLEEEEEKDDDDSLSSDSDEREEPNTPSSKKSDVSEAERTDITIKVFDPALKEWVTVCVVENKVLLTSQAMYQALCYACRKGLVNVELGRNDPIYVMVWAGTEWKVGVLYISGVVHVSEEKVMSADAKHRRMFNRARNLVKKSFAGEFTMDGKYLSGSYFMSPLTHVLPSRLRPLSEDALMFYEFLMRIVIGEEVQTWSTRDVDDAMAIRKKMDGEVREAIEKHCNKKPRLV